jgi:hypothetical protein
MTEQHKDRPPEEIIAMAKEAMANFHKQGAQAQVFFKFTCSHCGARCAFDIPNVLYETATCDVCNGVTKVEKAGFALQIKF